MVIYLSYPRLEPRDRPPIIAGYAASCSPLFAIGSISKTVTDSRQSGRLKRRPSGCERARFLEEESEARNKLNFIAGKIQRADVSAP